MHQSPGQDRCYPCLTTLLAATRNTERTTAAYITLLIIMMQSSLSTYRCLYRFSTSARPFHLSGSGRSDLVRIWMRLAATLTSPLSVFFMSPETPTMSPTSISCFKSLRDAAILQVVSAPGMSLHVTYHVHSTVPPATAAYAHTGRGQGQGKGQI